MADFPAPIFLVSLCTGGGRLDDGVRRALFPRPVVPILSVEIEAFAAAYLVGEMEAERLAPHPIWTDLAEIPGRTLDDLRGVAEGHGLAVCAGFPCTPWSTAGQRRGTEDERWIWDDIARILRHLRPGLVVLECTPGVTSGGLEQVLGTLAEIGLDAEWDCIRASDIGAPHQRARWWCVGISERFRQLLGDANGTGLEERRPSARGEVADSVEAGAGPMANTGSSGRRAIVKDEHSREPVAREGCADLANANGGGQPGQRRPDSDGRQDARWNQPHRRVPNFPPARDDRDGWLRVLADRPELAPAITRKDESATVRSLRGVAHGLVATERLDLLRLFGNGVVPQCAAEAIHELLIRLTG